MFSHLFLLQNSPDSAASILLWTLLSSEVRKYALLTRVIGRSCHHKMSSKCLAEWGVHSTTRTEKVSSSQTTRNCNATSACSANSSLSSRSLCQSLLITRMQRSFLEQPGIAAKLYNGWDTSICTYCRGIFVIVSYLYLGISSDFGCAPKGVKKRAYCDGP
jgi:hypothetical protein